MGIKQSSQAFDNTKALYLASSRDPVLRALGSALSELETMIDHHVRSASWLIADDNYHRELEAYHLEREHLVGLIAGLSPETASETREYLNASIYVRLAQRHKTLRN